MGCESGWGGHQDWFGDVRGRESGRRKGYRLSQVQFINRRATFVACRLPFNPSVYSAALRGGCCVSHPAWWMLVVLDCVVCLQSNKRRLLVLLPDIRQRVPQVHVQHMDWE